LVAQVPESVCGGAVIIFKDVVDHSLPVRFHLIRQAVSKRVIGDTDAAMLDLSFLITGLAYSRRRIRIKIDVDKAAEMRDLNDIEADVARHETLKMFAAACNDRNRAGLASYPCRIALNWSLDGNFFTRCAS